jgi:predicted DNA-binding transcriptional regulator AlpA
MRIFNQKERHMNTPIYQRYIPMSAKNGGPSVCAVLGLSPATVKRIAKRDASFPRPIVVASNCYRYKVDDIIAWADSSVSRGNAPSAGSGEGM